MQIMQQRSIFWQIPKTCLYANQSFQTKHRIVSDAIFTALYIFTQKLIHTKCPTLLKGTSKNAVIRSSVWSTVKEHPAFCSLSLHSSVWVSVWSREMSGAAEGLHCVGTRASCDWTLSGGVSSRASLRPYQECSHLISCKGA